MCDDRLVAVTASERLVNHLRDSVRDLGLDAPSTLLGQLQRGLGRGWRGALTQPREAGDFVVECAARDPRWDHQVESRSYFYSTLLWMLEAPVDALHPDRLPTRQTEFTGEHWLAIEVLARLAARGREDAVSLLVAHLQGADYEVAVMALHEWNVLEGRESLLWDNLSDEQVLALAQKWHRELPWDTWRSRTARRGDQVAVSPGTSWPEEPYFRAIP